MRRALAVAALALSLGACGHEQATPTPPPAPKLTSADLAKAVLSLADVGSGWTEQNNATTNTVQIGGKIGAANIQNPAAQATTQFSLTSPSPASLLDSVFLSASQAEARSVMAAHSDAALTTSWTQSRQDGGTTSFTIIGTVSGLDTLGDQSFTAKLGVDIKDKSGVSSHHTIEYVVYRRGAVIGFVVTQDVGAAPFARKQAASVDTIIGTRPR